MAYIDRFIFRFNSVSGKSVRIVIADDDYTGAAVERRLGGSPQLRCELSGNIRGMSLEIPAECKVDDEFAVLYTSDPTRFAVRVEMDNTVVWRGFVTPELYAAPWVDPPYDVQITATDGLGELKMKEWPAIGSRTLGEILETALGATGLALPVRMISAAATDLSTAANLLTGTTINLDHMAGKSYYDVLDGLLGSLRATIAQRGGAWLLVRETDVTALTSGGQVSDTTGRTYPVKAFGSSRSNDCWPVGRLTTEIVPAKSSVEVECPNKLAALITDPDMELNLWQTDGTWSAEDGGYYSLALGQNISQTASVANATRDADPGFRIKVSSRNTTPFDVGIMRLTVMATGRDPRSGSDKTLYLKEVTTQGRTQMEWVAEESHFDDGLEFPRTLDHQDCKEFVTDIFRLPTGFNPIKTITIRVSSGRNTVCVHSVNIECMSVYDKAVTRLLMDNGARGDESYSPLFADSFAGNKGNFLLSNSPKGVTGALVGTWSSEAIPSVPYGEWLAKDMALSVATPRLRMSGRLFTADALPALFYSNKGLSYITEEWDLDLIEDEADISLISLPAAALSTVSVSVIVEDNDGRKGTVSGGEIVSPKTGDSSSGSGYLDWFIAESYEEDGETKYRLKLNPKYEGMYAEGWVSAGGVSDQGGGGGGTGYLRDLLDVNASMSPTQGQALVWDDALGKWTAGDVSVDLTPFERTINKVTSISASSTDGQYPSARAVYNALGKYMAVQRDDDSDLATFTVPGVVRYGYQASVPSSSFYYGNVLVIRGEGSDTLAQMAFSYSSNGAIKVRSGTETNISSKNWRDLAYIDDLDGYYSKTPILLTREDDLNNLSAGIYSYINGNNPSNAIGNNASLIQYPIRGRNEKFQVVYDGNNEAMHFRRYFGGTQTWSDWKTLAFTSSNVASAGKLQTPKKIWGQSFDGTADISGYMTGMTGLLIGESTTPTLGTMEGATALGIKSTTERYGLWEWVTSNGTAHLQSGRGQGSAVAFPLCLQELGGNVGIGTDAPGYKLDVRGIGAFNGAIYANLYNGLGNKAGGAIVINKGGDYFGIGAAPSNISDLAFGSTTDATGTWKSVFGVIDNNGNVGLGKPIPSYKLDVNGDIRASGKVYIGTFGGYLEVVNVGTESSPEYALHSTLPLYSDSWVSAGGVSEQGGGGGGTGYLRDLLDVNASMSPTQGQALVWDNALGKWTSGDVSVDLTPFERTANRVTTVSSSSNHTQYPTAKAVYDIVNTMLSSAMRFQGVTSTALVDGSTTNPVVVDGASYTATRGDVVVRSDVGLEYLWTGARWQQLGDETSYAKKTVTITGSGYLTGGGNLEASSEIDIAEEIKTKIDNGAAAYANLGNYLPLTGGTLNSGSSSPTLTLNTTAPDSAIKYQRNGLDKAWIGYNAGAGVYLYNSFRSKYLSYKDDGSLLFENNKVWHAGNDGTDSGLDADLLDGLDSTRYLRRDSASFVQNKDADTIYGLQFASLYRPTNAPANYGGILSLPYTSGQASNPEYGWQLFFETADVGTRIHYRDSLQTAWNGWKSIAFLDDNVASATKLQTARTIWGQNFDGTANISGDITGAGRIECTGSVYANLYNGLGNKAGGAIVINKGGDYFGVGPAPGNIYSLAFGSTTDATGTWKSVFGVIDNNGNVGLGTEIPAYKLDVAGTVNINPPEAAVPAIRIVASGNSANHGINYVDASGNIKARFGVNSSTGLFQILANGDVTMRTGGTSTSGFTISAPATSGGVTSYMMYPAISGAISLNSTGAFSALGNGADLASPGTPMRSVSTKVIYLASGIYIYYDTVNNCIRTNAPIVSDSYISAGGVSTTSN